MNYIGQQKAEELYSELLGSDEEFLESLKSDAEKAGQGIKTDIHLLISYSNMNSLIQKLENWGTPPFGLCC